jgi:hypothetical protein
MTLSTIWDKNSVCLRAWALQLHRFCVFGELLNHLHQVMNIQAPAIQFNFICFGKVHDQFFGENRSGI